MANAGISLYPWDEMAEQRGEEVFLTLLRHRVNHDVACSIQSWETMQHHPPVTFVDGLVTTSPPERITQISEIILCAVLIRPAQGAVSAQT